MTTIERWTADQAELRAACAALVELVESPAPPALDVLVAARWRVARTLLRYLPVVDRVVYAPLRLHADRGAVAAVARFAAEAEVIYASFERHSQRWTPEAAMDAWLPYRLAVRAQAVRVKDRLDRERAELLPYLETAPKLDPVRGPNDRNWARDGWHFRNLLGMDSAAA